MKARTKEILDKVLPDIIKTIDKGYKVSFSWAEKNGRIVEKDGKYVLDDDPSIWYVPKRRNSITIDPFEAYLLGKNVLPNFNLGTSSYIKEILNLNNEEILGFRDGVSNARKNLTYGHKNLRILEFNQTQLDSYHVGKEVAKVLGGLNEKI